jgi:putative chitinase
MITANQLKKILKNTHTNEFFTVWAEKFSEAFPQYEINTDKRIAGFIAQVAHESGEFTRTSENLNYSAAALARTWPKLFATPQKNPNALALMIERKPQQIANIAYANKGGNGNEASGDGWKYRGRGLIQITLKNNYEAISQELGIDLINNPDWAETQDGALHTALAYWKLNNINRHCDSGDFEAMTKSINKAALGLKERLEYYNRALSALN